VIRVDELSGPVQLQKQHPKIVNSDTVENRTKRTQIGPQPPRRTPQRNHRLRTLPTVANRHQTRDQIDGISSDHGDGELTRRTFRIGFAHE
jgi:hypothetical protein